ncbi:MAG: hypothetical protein U1E45_12175 [Geminicoccaceae bacterium]
MSDANDLATLLRDLVDVLIPGGGVWPAASTVGVQGVLAVRLMEIRGESGPDELEAAIVACGGPLGGLDATQRVEVVRKFEATDPAFFTLVRNASYLAYYENPAVVRAVRTLGQPYQAMPGFKGYPIPAFDMEKDRPQHGRGSYIPTDQVKRLDLSQLGRS